VQRPPAGRLRGLSKKIDARNHNLLDISGGSSYATSILTRFPRTKNGSTKPREEEDREMAVKKKASPKKKAAKKSARKPNPAFMRPVQPDAVLAAVVGDKPLPRTELTKKLWAYIKKNGLQDKINKRNINADEKLQKVFGGKKTVSMFEMTKLVGKHIS
jgi:upstream activation factor subunit UAF30